MGRKEVLLMIKNLPELIKQCSQELHDREYLPSYADQLTCEWNAFLRWCNDNSILEFTPEAAYQYCDLFIGGHVRFEGITDKQRIRLRAIRMLVSYQQKGDFEFRSPKIERIFNGEAGGLISDFLEDSRTRGLSEKTIEYREMVLDQFNRYLNTKHVALDDLSIEIIEDFFQFMAYSLPSRHNAANVLRQFFHYLDNHNLSSRDYSLFVLKDNYRKGRKIPDTYSEEEIRSMISAINRSSATGKRDYLVVLLAAEYGWRASDIVSFRFDQIDWDQNVIRFDQHKTGVPVEFPLLSSVGNAIIDYLKYGRPRSDVPEVIVSMEKRKQGAALTSPTIHSIVTRYLKAADIPNWKEKQHGPHTLRRSLASNMLEREVPMPVISSVLGHQSTETTQIYLKVNIENLRKCPVPIPKMNSRHYREVKE